MPNPLPLETAPVPQVESTLQKNARRRRFMLLILFVLVACGGIAVFLRPVLFASVVPTATPTQTQRVEPTVKPQKVVAPVTVIVEKIITATLVPTIPPTQTPHVIYKSVVQPTYTPFATWTPSPAVNGVFFDASGCLVVSIWNVQEVYVNGAPAVGGRTYCDVKNFRVVVK